MGLIDVDKAKRAIMDEVIAPDWFKTVVCMALSNMQTVDPVKHGHWTIKEDNYGRKFGVCSECGNKDNVTTAVLGHYCWFCGTKMDEEVQR